MSKYDNKHLDANMKRVGIKRGGPQPEVVANFVGSTRQSSPSLSEEAVKAHNTIADEIMKRASVTDGKIHVTGDLPDIYEYVSSGHIGKNTQRVLEAFQQAINAGSRARVSSIDIENLGNLGSKLFNITEIGISGWQMKSGGISPINGFPGLSIVGHIGDESAIESLITKLKQSGSFTSLTAEESRTLARLAMYSDESSFVPQVFGGVKFNAFTGAPNKAILAPTANLKSKEALKLIEQGWVNLKSKQNNLGQIINVLNAYFKQVGKSSRLMGYNLLEHDIPGMLMLAEQALGGTDGASKEAAQTLTNTLKGFIKKNRVIDTYQIAEALYTNPLQDLGMADFIDPAKRALWRNLAGGHMKQENLSELLGLAPVRHTALDDSIVTGQLSNKLWSDLSGRLTKAVSGGAANTYNALVTSEAVVRRNTLGRGSLLFSLSGMGPSSSGPGAADFVFRLQDNKLVNAYGMDKPTPISGLFKNARYSLVDVFHTDSVFKNTNKYGSWVMTLLNEGEGTYHTFVRPENIQGTGIDSIRDILHKHTIPADVISSYAGANQSINDKLLDRAFRRYNKMFSTEGGGGYDLLKFFYDKHNTIGLGTTADQLSTTGALNRPGKPATNALIRDFTDLRFRMTFESAIVNPFIQAIDASDLSTEERNFATVALRDIMEGRISVEGVRQMSPAGFAAGRFGQPWTRGINLADGTINMGTFEMTRSGIATAARNSTLKGVINELQAKGYLTADEAGRLRAAAVRSNEGRVVEAVAQIMYNKAILANEYLEAKSAAGRGGTKVNKSLYTPEARKLSHGFVTFKTDSPSAHWSARELSDSERGLIINRAIQEGRARRSVMIGSGGTFSGLNNKWLLGVARTHDVSVSKQLASLNGSAVSRPGSALTALGNLASNYRTPNTATMLLSGYENHTAIMAVFDQGIARSVEQMTAEQILADERIVKMNVPFADKDRILTVGRSMRINAPFLYVDRGGVVRVGTGFDKITSAYMSSAKDITNLIASGKTSEAQRRANAVFNKVFTKLSGLGRFDRGEEWTENVIKTSSRAANLQRSEAMVIEGIAHLFTGKQWNSKDSNEAMNLIEKFNFKRNAQQYLYDKFGIVGNMHTLKEGQASAGAMISLMDIRKYVPFSEYSSAATMRMTQQLNVVPVDTGLVPAERLNPLVMKQAGLDFYGISAGESPWVTHRVAYANDIQLRDIMANAGLTFDEQPTTYEARGMMRRNAAELHNFSVINEFEATELGADIKVGATIGKGVTVGKVLSGAIINSSGEVVGSPVEVSTSIYNKPEGGKVLEILNGANGNKIVRVQRDLNAVDSMKFITNTGEKITAKLYDDVDWFKMFGDLGKQIHVVLASSAEKHNAWGDVFKSQVSTVVAALNENVFNNVTVGKAQKKVIQARVTEIISSFFGGNVKYGKVGNFQGLILPDTFTAPELAFSSFHTNVIDQIESEVFKRTRGKVKLGLRGQLVGEAHGVQLSLGYENFGRPFEEFWYRREGFDMSRPGVLKYGPRELEMMQLAGLGETARFYERRITSENRLLNRSLRDYTEYYRPGPGQPRVGAPAMGKLKRYGRVLNGLTGTGWQSGDVRFRTQGTADLLPNEVSYSSLRSLPELGPREPNTIDRYFGTWLDLKTSFVRGAESPGGMTEGKFQQIMKTGGAWFELPIPVHYQGKQLNNVFLPFGYPQSLGSGDIVQADRITAESSKVLRAIDDINTAMSSGGADIGRLEKRLTNAIVGLGKATAEDVSGGHGFFGEKLLSAKLHGTGQFRLQNISPFANVEEGVGIINEEAFKEMMSGKGVRANEVAELLKKAKTEGLFVPANRFPTVYEESVDVIKLMVNNKIATTSDVMMFTVGEAIKRAGDSDGDFASVSMAHYKNKSVRAMKVRNELESNWNARAAQRAEHAQYVMDSVTAKPNSQDWFDRLNSVTAQIRTSKEAAIEAIEARAGREWIGSVSNISSVLRRSAITYANAGVEGFAMEDARKVANLGALLEQGPISSKHFSIESLREAAAQQQVTVGDIMTQRATAVEDVVEGLLSGDKERFIRGATPLGFLELNKTRAEMDIDPSVSAKLRVRQKWSFNEMWDAAQKLGEIGDRPLRNFKTHASMRVGVSGGIDNLKLLSEALNGDLTGTVPNQIYSKIVEGLGMTVDTTGFRESVEAASLGMSNAWSSNPLMAKEFFSGADDMVTVGETWANRMAASAGRLSQAASWGTSFGRAGVAFAGLMIAANAFTDPLPANMMPQADKAPPVDGGYIPTPDATPGGPTARVTSSGSGYENIQIAISAMDKRGLSDAQISKLIQQQIEEAMPIKTSLSINTTDNTQTIDRQWVQSVVNDAVSQGQVFN